MRTANGLDEFYSRYKSNGDFEYFVDDRGNYERGYPHVHIIFYESRNIVRVIASQDRGDHRWQIDLDEPDGSDVNSAIRTAIECLNW